MSFSSRSIIRMSGYPRRHLTNDMANDAMPKGRVRTCGNTAGLKRLELQDTSISIIWPRDPPDTPDLSGKA